VTRQTSAHLRIPSFHIFAHIILQKLHPFSLGGLWRNPPLFRIIPNIDSSRDFVKFSLAMKLAANKKNDNLSEQLSRSGFRFTPQRRQVYEVLMRERDHPTAEEVFIRSKKRMPEISMATVYNCLTALVTSGLARQVSLQRGAARFCPNMEEHCHFYCDQCEQVFDIDLPEEAHSRLPKGFEARSYDVAIHGSCPECSGKK
jgi:Fur family peroxide stress response transcriptional regulator